MQLKPLSERAASLPISSIKIFTDLKKHLEAKGKRVYDLSIGDPNSKIAEDVTIALENIIKNTKSIPYADSRGLNNLLNAWQTYYKKLNVTLKEEDIIVTSGSSEALIIAAQIIFNQGDEYLIFEPFYEMYKAVGHLVKAEPLCVSLDEHNGFHLPSKENIISYITPKTKAIFITNPNNPTGTIFSETELQTLIEISREFGLYIICDEVYREICFDNKKCPSILEIASENDMQNIIVIDSVSKKLKSCGIRIGVMISKNNNVIKNALSIAQMRISVSYLDQEAIFQALANAQIHPKWLSSYQNKRNILISRLEELLKISIKKPEGAFYIVIKLPLVDTNKFARWMLESFLDKNETVMLCPCSGFYETYGKGLDELRLSFVHDEKDLIRSADLLYLGYNQYLNSIQ